MPLDNAIQIMLHFAYQESISGLIKQHNIRDQDTLTPTKLPTKQPSEDLMHAFFADFNGGYETMWRSIHKTTAVLEKEAEKYNGK
jgi:hypothetical protein